MPINQVSKTDHTNILIIFDFDGTLVNSFDTAIKKFNLLANEFNLKQISTADINILRNLTSWEVIKYLDIPLYKIPNIILKARKYMQDEILQLPPFPDLHVTLAKFYEKGIYLGIVTSNSYDNVTLWLKHHQLDHLFNFIHNENLFFGKYHVLKRIIKKYPFQKNNIYYVGDETRDIAAAKKLGVQSVAVTWGFNSEEILTRFKPHFLVRNTVDLLKIVE
jgi:phosphoglycolate phosphatase